MRLIPDVGYEPTVVIDTLFAGTYQLSAADSNKCLDLASASPTDGVLVQQATCKNGNATQKWRVELVDKGAYRLVSASSNKASTLMVCTCPMVNRTVDLCRYGQPKVAH